ncbi:MAG: hypothetical protein GY859_32915, partial [Desulfobacterales bacterium]|nr:hypothetical protein [Desulfobacterales bacterium]
MMKRPAGAGRPRALDSKGGGLFICDGSDIGLFEHSRFVKGGCIRHFLRKRGKGSDRMEMSDLYTPGAELAGRIQRLKGHMAGSGVDGALILQKADLFYFSGSVQQAHLYIPVEGEPILMVRKDFDRAARESALERIVPLKSPGSIPDILKENGLPLPDALGMELDVLPTNLYFAHRDIFNGTRL